MPDWRKLGETKLEGTELGLIVLVLLFGGTLLFGFIQGCDKKASQPSFVPLQTQVPQKLTVSEPAVPVSDFERGKALYDGWKADREGDKVDQGLRLLESASKSGSNKAQAKALFRRWKKEAVAFQKQLEQEIRESEENERISSYSFTRGTPIQIAVSDAIWIKRSDGWVARVDLRIKNVALDPISIGPNNFKLDGQSYDLSETARCDDFLYSQEIEQESVTRGWVAFKVPYKTKLSLEVVDVSNCFTDSKYVYETYPHE